MRFRISISLYRVHTTVEWELTSHLEETFLMLTTRLACMPGLTSVGPMGKSCLGRSRSVHALMLALEELIQCVRIYSPIFVLFLYSGSTKWVLVSGLKQETISGVRDTFLRQTIRVLCLLLRFPEMEIEVRHSDIMFLSVFATENNWASWRSSHPRPEANRGDIHIYKCIFHSISFPTILLFFFLVKFIRH